MAIMRGADRQTAKLFSYISPEGLVPQSHPLRAIRPLVNAALERLSGDFDAIYSSIGRDSIAPEKLLRALLLQAFFSVRLERQLMEQLTYNMMFRWFVGLSMDAPVWDVTVLTKNRERLLQGDIACRFLAAILVDPAVVPLLSDEHFSVDGTLIEAWASMKSFKQKTPPLDDAPQDQSGGPPAGGRNAEVDFKGRTHSNQTHASTTDPDARLYKKAQGQAAKLCHMGHHLGKGAVDIHPYDTTHDLSPFKQRERRATRHLRVANRNHRGLGSQSSAGRARDHCNGSDVSGPQSLHLGA